MEDVEEAPAPYEITEAQEAAPGVWIAVILREGNLFCVTPGYPEEIMANAQGAILCGALTMAHQLTQEMMRDEKFVAHMLEERKKVPKELRGAMRKAMGMPSEDEEKLKVN